MSISELELRRKLLIFFYKLKKIAEANNSPRWIIFFSDMIISSVAVLLAYLLRFNFSFEAIAASNLSLALALILTTRAAFSIIYKNYAHVIRYTSIHDIRRIFVNIAAGTAVVFTVNFILRIGGKQSIPISIILIELFITLYLMSNLRIFIKYLYMLITNFDLNSNPTIIVGSKELAVIVKEALEFHPNEKFKPVLFLDSKPIGKKNRLSGLPIYTFEDLADLIEKHNISSLVIAKRDLFENEKELLVKVCKEYGIRILRVPEIWLSGNIDSSEIKEVKVEELLDREPINLEKKHIESYIQDKCVLISGAAGSIGNEIVRQITTYKPKTLIILDQAETPLYDIEMELIERFKQLNFRTVLADITNKKRIEMVFEKYKPDIVYHAAAYKHVPMMEANPIEAFQNNVIGTRILADVSVQYGVEKFVMVSTDKAVNPTGIMGATKRIAEMYIQSLNDICSTNFVTTRFGNVLNSNGSVIPRFLKQIKQGGPVTVTHPEITRFFMTIPEACQLVLEASVMGNGGEIFLFDMGKAVKILDLAKNLIKSTGHLVGQDIKIQFTGLRPGEKLYEELLLEAENHKPTHHPKIMIADVCQYSYQDIAKQLDKCAVPVESQNTMKIVTLMKEIVPTYKSNNSVFEKLDKKAV